MKISSSCKKTPIKPNINGKIIPNVNLEDFEYDIDFYNSYLLQSMGSSVHNIAVESKKQLAAADSDTEALRRFTAYFLLGNSMMNTSGILYKFAKDVGMI